MTVRAWPPMAVLTTPLHVLRWSEWWAEFAGRTATRSHRRIRIGQHGKFLRARLREEPFPHESVVEHVALHALILCSRSTSLQLVRHRLASPTQESQRYVALERALDIVPPVGCSERTRASVIRSAERAHADYLALLADGARPEEARAVLPECTATRLCFTANARQWRHIWRLRCDSHAQAEIRGLATSIRDQVCAVAPWAGEGMP